MSRLHNVKGASEVEDFQGHKYTFVYPYIADFFRKIDKLEEVIREKYFDSDIEFIEGIKMAQRMKGQIRKFDKDYNRLETIRFRGLPDEESDF